MKEFRQRIVFGVIFLVFSIILGLKLFTQYNFQHIVIIILFSILLFSFALVYSLMFLFYDGESFEVAKINILTFKYEFIIAIIIIIVTLPLLTESSFYYDDYWILGNKTLNISSILMNARPLHSIYFLLLNNINISNAYILKWIALPAIVLYSIILFKWIYSNTNKKLFSLFLSCILGTFSPIMDFLGYGSVTPLAYSILFSVLSVLVFDIAYKDIQKKLTKKGIGHLIIAVLMLITSLLIYQIGVQTVFILLTITVYFNVEKKSSLKFIYLYLLLFGTSNIIYLIFVKIIRWTYHIEAYRSQFAFSLPQLLEKITFYKSIIYQSIMQVISVFTGGRLILERYHGYYITFSNKIMGEIVFIFVLVMIILAFIDYLIKTKSIWRFLSLIIFIPMSYFVFLIIVDNGYLTYYAVAHISLFVFYFIMGLIVFINFLCKIFKILGNKVSANNIQLIVVALLFIISAFMSNYYIRDFYVNYNNSVYNFVKYSLESAFQSENINRIHVNGLISPINADVYSGFITKTAIEDLGKNPADYVITYSRNKYFLMRMEKSDYDRITSQISEEDKQLLERIYAFGSTYSQYYIKAWPSENEQNELQRIFTDSDAIPRNNSTSTLIIDITWTDNEYNNLHVK